MVEPASPWPDLRHGEIEIEDSEELLWRQVNPQFLHNGQVTSQAFRPSPEDQGLLSTSRQYKQTAHGAFEFHVNVRRYESAGTWALSIGEVRSAGLRAIDDGESDTGPPAPCPPGHTSIDFRPFGKSAIRKKSAGMSFHANLRGCMYRPPELDDDF